MTDLASLVRRATDSADGEAYAAVATGRGFRIGVGARTGPAQEPSLFVEVVLDPFPERPRVSPRRLADQSEVVAWLEARGYAVACDDDSTITCERSLDLNRVTEELRVLRQRMEPAGPIRGTRLGTRGRR